MSKLKQKIRRNYEDTIVAGLVCDICKREVRGDGWKKDQFDIEDVSVSYRSGSSYPEGGSATTYEYDVCPECFMEKLVPLLRREYKAEYEEVESDW